MNSKMLLGIIVLVVVVAGGFLLIKNNAPTPSTTQPSEESTVNQEKNKSEKGAMMGKNEIEIKDFAFAPNTLTVKVGTKVTWTNKDAAGHSATADDGSFDTGIIEQGESGEVTFDKTGTFTYHCTPHPNIQATIVVEE